MTLYEPKIIDPHPADGGGYRSQWMWTIFFNSQRRPMISAADVYGAGKSASDELLQSLRRDFDLSSLVSSTRISYSGDNLSGRVTQNYGSEVIAPFQKNLSIIPVYNCAPLEGRNYTSLAEALRTKEGVDYLQALFDTNDDPEIIAGTLEHLSGKNADYTVVWTPDKYSRKRDPEGAVSFSGRDWFHINGGTDTVGALVWSRGVTVSPRSGPAKK